MTYLISLIIFLLVDAVWLGLVARSFYAQQLGSLMTDKPIWLAAGIFYILFIIGLNVFVINPALKTDTSLLASVLHGALFGLVCCATYDLTNLATIKNWPMIMTIIDLVWGSTLSAVVTGLTLLILRRGTS